MPSLPSIPTGARPSAVATAGGIAPPGARAIASHSRVLQQLPELDLSDPRTDKRLTMVVIMRKLSSRGFVHYTTTEPMFNEWLKEKYSGTQLAQGAEQLKDQMTESTAEVKSIKGAFQTLKEKGIHGGESYAVEDFKRIEVSPENIELSCQDFFEAIRSALVGSITDIDLGDITEAASQVVDSIPYLGTITAAVKVVITGGQIASLINEVLKVDKMQMTSVSELERETLNAIKYFESRKGIKLGNKMTFAAAGVITSVVGGGAIVASAKALTTFIMNVTFRIVDYIVANKVNGHLKSGNLDLSKLREAHVLGLHLPHLPSVTLLELSGLLPIGWQKDRLVDLPFLREAVEAAIKEQAEPAQPWLTRGSMQWVQGNYKSNLPKPPKPSSELKSNPVAQKWSKEYERIEFLYAATDKYLLTQGWRLYRLRKLVHDPQETGFVAEIKAQTLDTLKSVIAIK